MAKSSVSVCVYLKADIVTAARRLVETEMVGSLSLEVRKALQERISALEEQYGPFPARKKDRRILRRGQPEGSSSADSGIVPFSFSAQPAFINKVRDAVFHLQTQHNMKTTLADLCDEALHTIVSRISL